MICHQNRRTTLLLLAAYLYASTLGSVLHSHDHDSASADATGHAAGDSHGHAQHAHAGHHHDHAPCEHPEQGQSNPADSPEHHDHDDCTVCQFLGQVSLPVQVVSAEMDLGVSAESPVALMATPSYGVERATLHLRAGPSV